MNIRNIDKVNELLKSLPKGWTNSSWKHDELDSVSLDNSILKIWIASPNDNLGVAGSFNYSLQTDDEIIIDYRELTDFLNEFKNVNICM